MTELKQTIALDLTARYKKLAGVIRELGASLSEEQFWAKPFAFGNSVGHLLLHLTGNLNYYIGAQIAGTGYVRNRPLEFSDATKKSKEQVLGDFDRGVRMVVETIRKRKPEDWTKAYAAEREPESKDRFTVF